MSEAAHFLEDVASRVSPSEDGIGGGGGVDVGLGVDGEDAMFVHVRQSRADHTRFRRERFVVPRDFGYLATDTGFYTGIAVVT